MSFKNTSQLKAVDAASILILNARLDVAKLLSIIEEIQFLPSESVPGFSMHFRSISKFPNNSFPQNYHVNTFPILLVGALIATYPADCE